MTVWHHFSLCIFSGCDAYVLETACLTDSRLA
nr:MAG TPA: hypothetical protein [Caudoviricetes sp.]